MEANQYNSFQINLRQASQWPEHQPLKPKALGSPHIPSTWKSKSQKKKSYKTDSKIASYTFIWRQTGTTEFPN